MAAVNQQKFIADCVKSTNDFRAKHGVPALRLNPDISKISQRWADHLASTSSMGHNPNPVYSGERLGENVAMKWNGPGIEITGSEMIEQWYNEVKNYDFRSHSGPGTGHFTQLVWKGSREVGFGRATSRDGKYFLVANYFPAGNYIGRNAENVCPPTSGRIVLNDPAPKQVITQTPVRITTDSSGTKPSRINQLISGFWSSPSSTPVVASTPPRTTSQPFQSGPSPKITVQASPSQSGTPSRITVHASPSQSGPPPRITVVQEPPFQSGFTSRRQQETTTSSGGSTAGGFTKTVTVTETVVGPDGRQTTTKTKTVTTQNDVDINRFGSRDDDVFAERLQTLQIEKNSVPTTTNSQKPSWFSSSPRSLNITTTPAVSNSASAAATGSQKTKEFIDDIVKSHNRYRKLHGKVPDLVHSKPLSEVAQSWAERLASTSTLQHSGASFKGQPMGENLACKYGSGKVEYSGTEVVDNWYEEVKNYNYNFPNERSSLQKIGHFTQVVWRGSREIGVGRAWSSDGRQVFVVCNYLPAGNVYGTFKENVSPK